MTGVQAKSPVTRSAALAGLAQRAASGWIGVGAQRTTGQGCSQGVVMNVRRQIGRRNTERGGNVDGRAAAEAVAAARKAMILLVLMERSLPVVVGMLPRAGVLVSPVQVKRSVGVAAGESERQQQDDAAQEQRPLHGTIMYLRRVEKARNPP